MSGSYQLNVIPVGADLIREGLDIGSTLFAKKFRSYNTSFDSTSTLFAKSIAAEQVAGVNLAHHIADIIR